MNDLGELFARDPCNLSTDDIAVMVAKLREHQTQYELGVKAPKAAAAPKKPTKAQDLLKDLGLS